MFSEVITFLKTWGSHWIVQIFFVVFGALLVDLIQKRVVHKLCKKAEKTKKMWDDAVLGALKLPLTLLIWVLGLCFAAEIIQKETGSGLFFAIEALRYLGIIAAGAWFAIRLVKQGEVKVLSKYGAKGKSVDKTTVDAVAKVLRASIVVTAILVALQTLGFSLSGVLAFGGVGGIAVGFAAKDLLANFFGGFMIYWDRPFKIGDWIRSPDREIEGTVEHIGWRLTRIRTFDQRPLYIPNSIFTTIAVENPSRMLNRRIYEKIGVRYKDASKVANILEKVREMLQSHPEIDQSQTLMVNLDQFSPSSLEFFIYTFTKTTVWTRFHEIKEEVLLKIHQIILEGGGEIAFPTTTVHLPSPESIGVAPLSAKRPNIAVSD